MLDCAASGRHTLLRFYGWDPWCLSLGRHQAAPRRLLGRPRRKIRPGVDAVRRPTGGRSVFHGPEITYAFACPARAWGGPRAVFRLVHGALAAGLRSLGVPLDDDLAVRGGAAAAGANPNGRPERNAGSLGRDIAPSQEACFAARAPGELTIGGRKVVGSAQCRRRGGLLQHGSILLEDRQGWGDLSEDRRQDASRGGWRSARSAVGLREAVDVPLRLESIVARLEARLAESFGTPAVPSEAVGVAQGALRRETAPSGSAEVAVAAAERAHGPTGVAAAIHRSARGFETRHRTSAWLWRASGTVR